MKKVLKRKLNYANIYLACEKYANRGVAQLVEYVVWDHGAGGSSPLTPTNAGVAELADALDLGSSVFDVGVQVLSPAPIDSYFDYIVKVAIFLLIYLIANDIICRIRSKCFLVSNSSDNLEVDQFL